MAKIRQFKGKYKADARLMQGCFKADFLQETLILDRNKRGLHGCKQCLLHKPSCGDICLLGSPTMHVSRIIKYNFWEKCRRYIAHLLYDDYNKPLF